MGSSIICGVFILSFLLISVSTHGVVKRAAADGELYVFSSRKGCVKVDSMEPCPVNWTLTPVYAKQYEMNSKGILVLLKLLDLIGLSEECKNNIKATSCSQVTPRCFEDGSKDYGEAKKTCQKILDTCPQAITDAYEKQRLCEKIFTGKQPESDCVFPPEDIPGTCPQPKYKMPADILKKYGKSSQSLTKTFEKLRKARYPDSQRRMFSTECVSKYKEVVCPSMYCSTDEQRLLSKYNYEDCMNVITICFKKPFETLSTKSPKTLKLVKQMEDMLNSSCQTYPKLNSTRREAAPSTSTAISHSPKSLLSLIVFALSLVKRVAFV